MVDLVKKECQLLEDVYDKYHQFFIKEKTKYDEGKDVDFTAVRNKITRILEKIRNIVIIGKDELEHLNSAIEILKHSQHDPKKFAEYGYFSPKFKIVSAQIKNYEGLLGIQKDMINQEIRLENWIKMILAKCEEASSPEKIQEFFEMMRALDNLLGARYGECSELLSKNIRSKRVLH